MPLSKVKSQNSKFKSAETNPKQSVMDSLMASYDNRRLNFNRGEKIIGEVINITDSEIILDLKAKAEGVLNKKELPHDKLENLKIGDRLELYVAFAENESGQIVLSLFRQENLNTRSKTGRKIDFTKWQKFIQGRESGNKFTGEISEINRGGLIVSIDGLRGFIPSSQLSLRGLSHGSNLSDLTGQNLKLTVIEVDPSNNKLVFSARPVLSEEEKTELIKFKAGDSIKGEILAVTPFGLFIQIRKTQKDSENQNIGKSDNLKFRNSDSSGTLSYSDSSEVIEGIVYPQETTWVIPAEGVEIDLNKNYKAGQSIEAKIINIDEGLGRLNLSIRQMEKDPFEEEIKKFAVDDVVTGVITNITQNGVEVKLQSTPGEPPSTALGTSGLTPGVFTAGFLPAEKMEDQGYLLNQKTNFLVDSIDTKNRRINLAPFLTSTVGLIYK